MNNDTILSQILEALDQTAPEVTRVLTYVFDQLDSGKRDETDALYLIATVKPILKRLGA